MDQSCSGWLFAFLARQLLLLAQSSYGAPTVTLHQRRETGQEYRLQRASDLVFISANLRMLGKEVIAKADPFVGWEQQQEKENAQDEVTGEMHIDDDDDDDSLDS